eukprot:6187619-Pleurochrysis_carterae.AAC.2
MRVVLVRRHHVRMVEHDHGAHGARDAHVEQPVAVRVRDGRVGETRRRRRLGAARRSSHAAWRSSVASVATSSSSRSSAAEELRPDETPSLCSADVASPRCAVSVTPSTQPLESPSPLIASSLILRPPSPASPSEDQRDVAACATCVPRGASSVDRMMRSRSSPWIWSMDWMKSGASSCIECARRQQCSCALSSPSSPLHASTIAWISARCGRFSVMTPQLIGSSDLKRQRYARISKSARSACAREHARAHARAPCCRTCTRDRTRTRTQPRTRHEHASARVEGLARRQTRKATCSCKKTRSAHIC